MTKLSIFKSNKAKKIAALLLLIILPLTFAFSAVGNYDITLKAEITEERATSLKIGYSNAVITGISGANLNYVDSTTGETINDSGTFVSGVSLNEGGSFYFNLVSESRVNLGSNPLAGVRVLVTASDFVRKIVSTDPEELKNANITLALDTTTPAITIPEFDNKNNDQNISVSYPEASRNEISIHYNPGVTKENLVVGTFQISWQGDPTLPAGTYEARVSVEYSVE